MAQLNVGQIFLEDLQHSLNHSLSILSLQVISILLATRVMSFLARKLGQPAVIGEIIAGIALGPSILGMYAPQVSAFLFPEWSWGNLQFISQMGLIFFMFIIGLELDLNSIRQTAREALVISHVSIAGGFLAGAWLARQIYAEYAQPGAPFLAFALFMGIAMSIAAFPVFARIVQERGWSRTPFGNQLITCAAVDDFTAWCLLAIVIAVSKARGLGTSLLTFGFIAVYLALMIWVVRPIAAWVGRRFVQRGELTRPQTGIVFMIMLLSAYMTELIGIHALIGAFIAGVIMPQNQKFKHTLIEKLEDLATLVFLPLFFVFTGLRTEMGALNEAHLWQVVLTIIGYATLGKFGSAFLASKLMGYSWKNALITGSLMNTRGLMELVVLNIGYDLGILSKTLFAMMVIMALATTFMTGPLLNLISWLFRRSEAPVLQMPPEGALEVPIESIESPDMKA
ncbi:MAG: cation:proton antiporter [Bacteroidia bacterium]|nr:cation:proton antiporter [Bacteroidia bacterium]